jgi:hypothetical protein
MVEGAANYWNPTVLDVLCGVGGIAGRVEGILLPKVVGTEFERYAVELLNSFESDKGAA